MNPLPEIEYDEWFHQKHPHDDMPIATNDRFDMYGSSDADDAYSSRHETTPVFEKSAEEIVTMHEKAYRLADRIFWIMIENSAAKNIDDFIEPDPDNPQGTRNTERGQELFNELENYVRDNL